MLLQSIPPSTNCTHELVCARAIVATYVVSTILFAIVPRFVYMIITCINMAVGAIQHYCLLIVYANLGSILYYYGDNITKVVNMVGDTFQCLEDCQSFWRASGVAALFIFLLINQIYSDWHKDSNSKYWWGPAMGTIVKLVNLDAFYTAFIHVARSNMISTPTIFCRGVDIAFVAIAVGITLIYGIYSICYSCYKVITFNGNENPSPKYKWVVGVCSVVIWFTFSVYLLVDNLLPLNFHLCGMPKAEFDLHVARCVLSFFCALSVSIIFILYAVPSYRHHYTGCCKKRSIQSQFSDGTEVSSINNDDSQKVDDKRKFPQKADHEIIETKIQQKVDDIMEVEQEADDKSEGQSTMAKDM